jgi:hypothetical protein
MREPILTIAAKDLVPASPESVFAFLSDLDDHWLLAGRFIEVVELEGPPGSRTGGRVRMRGPLGVRRTVTTDVAEIRNPGLIRGTARVGPTTEARVEWTLVAEAGETRVRLAAAVTRASLFDRAVLALGGAWWLRRRFRQILAVLVRHFRPGAHEAVGHAR